MKKMLPAKLYEQIAENVPLVCVDILLAVDNGFLLVKRKKPPFKGWWLPGGRVIKGESLQKAALRKLREETSVNGKIVRMIGVYETKSRKAHFNIKSGTHTVNICYLAKPKGKARIKIDDAHSGFRIFSRIEKGLPAYIRQVIRDSGLLT